jgi:hypothetical protein
LGINFFKSSLIIFSAPCQSEPGAPLSLQKPKPLTDPPLKQGGESGLDD